jgi:alkane 1-monooxygenase
MKDFAASMVSPRGLALTAIAITFLFLMTMGGVYYYVAAVVISGVFAFMDIFAGHDVSEPDGKGGAGPNAQAYRVPPAMLWFGLCYAWYLGHGDLFHLGALMKHFGIDMFARRAQTTPAELIVGCYCVGTIWAGFGTTIGHELTHRTWSKVDMLVGRWMLALTSDASFSIEHVYGHHLTLGTPKDPATARRGETLYHFIIRSTFGQIASAWHLETGRLKRQKLSIWSFRNRIFTGWAMTACYAAVFYAAAGWVGLVAFFAASWFGKCYLEAINYIEHYGIVRVPGTPIEPRHSWNCTHRISSWLLFNLPRHSHHHAMGDKPYWELRSYQDAPQMPFGYLTMIYIALIPPLYRKLVHPRLQDWDRRYAVPAEYRLIEAANKASGMADLAGENLVAAA